MASDGLKASKGVIMELRKSLGLLYRCGVKAVTRLVLTARRPEPKKRVFSGAVTDTEVGIPLRG